MEGISVIICCYNSASRIEETLKHISKQNIPVDFNWEVLIVNNNSSDNTAEIAQKTWTENSSKKEFCIVQQSKPGLSHARQKGVSTAIFDYIIFCDDDNWLDENYVYNAFRILNENIKIGAVGGQGLAVCEKKPPSWFEEKKASYAVGKQLEKTGLATHRGYLWGAGIAIKKDLLLKAKVNGFKSYLTGRNGTKLEAGDDSEMCNWIIILGYELWYDERLSFKHFIPKERLTNEYINKITEGFKRSTIWIHKYSILISIKKLKRSRLINFVAAVKLWIFFRNRISLTYIQFLLGPFVKVSSKEDHQFIKTYYKQIYDNNTV